MKRTATVDELIGGESARPCRERDTPATGWFGENSTRTSAIAAGLVATIALWLLAEWLAANVLHRPMTFGSRTQRAGMFVELAAFFGAWAVAAQVIGMTADRWAASIPSRLARIDRLAPLTAVIAVASCLAAADTIDVMIPLLCLAASEWLRALPDRRASLVDGAVLAFLLASAWLLKSGNVPLFAVFALPAILVTGPAARHLPSLAWGAAAVGLVSIEVLLAGEHMPALLACGGAGCWAALGRRDGWLLCLFVAAAVAWSAGSLEPDIVLAVTAMGWSTGWMLASRLRPKPARCVGESSLAGKSVLPSNVTPFAGRQAEIACVAGLFALMVAYACFNNDLTLLLAASVPVGFALAIREGRNDPLAVVEQRSKERRSRLALTVLMMIAALTVRAAYWANVDRVWEDALITLRHAENALAGKGMTHHPGHGLVHGFTSPLSVLIPLVGEWLHRGWGLPAIKLASLLAGVAAIPLAHAIATRPGIGLSLPMTVAWQAYLAMAYSQVAFGMAGMEAQLWTTTFLLGAWLTTLDRPAWLGAALALGVYCRPDAVVWAVVAGAAESCKSWRRAVIVGVVAMMLYLPWLGWTTWYYGSPVPHTVRAKGEGYKWNTQLHAGSETALAEGLKEAAFDLRSNLTRLAPYYDGTGYAPQPSVPAADVLAWVVLAAVCVGAVMLTRPGGAAIVAGVVVHAFVLYLIVYRVFPWYLPGLLAGIALLAAKGFDAWAGAFGHLIGNRLRWAGVGVVAAALIWPIRADHLTDDAYFRHVDLGVRWKVGEWIDRHAGPKDTVAVECLGFVGSAANRKIYDYPGLCSPEALAALNRDGTDRNMAPIIEQLRPDWLVLRTFETTLAGPDYEPVQVMAVTDEQCARLSRYYPLAAEDCSFTIYRRKR